MRISWLLLTALLACVGCSAEPQQQELTESPPPTSQKAAPEVPAETLQPVEKTSVPDPPEAAEDPPEAPPVKTPPEKPRKPVVLDPCLEAPVAKGSPPSALEERRKDQHMELMEAGRAKMIRGDYEGAAKDYKRAVVCRDDKQTRTALAGALDKGGDACGALEQYQRALIQTSGKARFPIEKIVRDLLVRCP